MSDVPLAESWEEFSSDDYIFALGDERIRRGHPADCLDPLVCGITGERESLCGYCRAINEEREAKWLKDSQERLLRGMQRGR